MVLSNETCSIHGEKFTKWCSFCEYAKSRKRYLKRVYTALYGGEKSPE